MSFSETHFRVGCSASSAIVLIYYFHRFLACNQERKVISGAVRRLWDYENATKETETDQKEKEKGSERTTKVSSHRRIYNDISKTTQKKKNKKPISRNYPIVSWIVVVYIKRIWYSVV